MPNYYDSGTHSLTHLAALNATTAHIGDIGSAEAVARLHNLRAAVFYGVPIVSIEQDRIIADIAAPPEKEEPE